jgi:hypothetical protein|tara:strand:+ start:476 stop:652 length:177 start_codon:yes stop_codon:yes gene_type:complete
VKYEIDEVIDAVHHVLKESKDTNSFMHHHATLVTLELMKSWGLVHISVAGVKIKNTNK